MNTASAIAKILCSASSPGAARVLPILTVVLAAILTGLAADSTNAPAKLPPAPDYSTFRIISERNIFNASRSGQSRRTERRRPNRVDSFGLVGILEYEKGRFAFFDGTSPEYKKAVRAKGSIAGYTVLEIAPDRVKLASGTNNVMELKVGMQMRREDEGEWTLGEFGGSYASEGSGSTLSPPGTSDRSRASSSPEMDDVVRRLMQQREREAR
ncbi:MAG: hypothetical protein QHJ82_12655 [Verrucomicrobiota bacterium]|nr:hypothetical protein [Verrucomicrobiota bacterium]